MRRILILTITLLICVSGTLSAQILDAKHSFVFNHLGVEDGIGNQRVYSLCQDRDNALWFSTKNSIERYNGVSMSHYYLDNKTLGELGGLIIRVTTDDEGNVYAYSSTGKLYRFQPLTNTFELVKDLSTDIKAEELILNDVFIYKGETWYALREGLYVAKGGKAEAVFEGIQVNSVRNAGNSMAVATDDGIRMVNMNDHKVSFSSKGYEVLSLYYDSEVELLWIGTFNHGIKMFNTSSHKMLQAPKLEGLTNKPARSIERLDGGTMLIGVDGLGVYGSSRSGDKVWLMMEASDSEVGYLHGNGVYDILRDRWGNVLIGSYSGGVDIAIPTGGVCEQMMHERMNAKSLVNDHVNCVLQTSHGKLLMGTDDGVSITDRKKTSWAHTFRGKIVLGMLETTQGRILIATYGDGVYELNGDGSCKQLYSLSEGTLKTDYVYSFYEDKDHNIWIGCLNGDMVEIKANGDKKYYPVDNVQAITGLPDGRIAVATVNGLYFINDKTSHVSKALKLSSEYAFDFNQYILDIYVDHFGRLWIATDGGGIIECNLDGSDAHQYTVNEGLPSNNCNTIEEDDNGKIWISSDRGIAFISRNGDERKITNISYILGIEREYIRGAVQKTADGCLLYGSTSGAVVVNCAIASALSYEAPVHIMQIVVQGEDEDVAEKCDIMRLFNETGKVALDYSQNTFEIFFESINLAYQHDIVYQYRLTRKRFTKDDEGIWSTATDKQSISFKNLEPGSYELTIRSVSRTSGKVLDERTIMLTVSSPWWNSWWMWCVYMLLLAGIVYFLWRYNKERMLQASYEDKMDFFVKTAHEIRTPLSLTLAPLNDIADDKNLSEDSRKFITIAQKNGARLMNTVTELLEFERSTPAEEKFIMRKVDVRNTLLDLIDRFAPTCRQKSIHLSLARCPEHLYLWIDATKLDKILDNLVSNAVKYTPDGGRVTLEAIEERGRIAILVQDNGIGIPDKDQKQLFHNFFRAENAVNQGIMGSGLGLMLVKHLVEKQKGTISYKSVVGKGTTFRITFPTGIVFNDTDDEEKIEKEEVDTIIPVFDENDDRQDTILFVDDNPELRGYAVARFGKIYNVIPMSDAQSALKFLETGYCDLIISDVMMPGMQGDEFCQKVKSDERTSWIPVILLTAKAGREFQIDGLKLGADDYINKPFDSEILQSKIDSLISNRRRIRDFYLKHSISMATEQKPADMAAFNEESDTKDMPTALNDSDREFIDSATAIVVKNMGDSDFCIDDLCSAMAMSRSLFFVRIKSLTGKAPQDFIRIIRMEKAAALIKSGMPVLDAATQTGFENSKYFSTVFKKYYGVPPSKYKGE